MLVLMMMRYFLVKHTLVQFRTGEDIAFTNFSIDLLISPAITSNEKLKRSAGFEKLFADCCVTTIFLYFLSQNQFMNIPEVLVQITKAAIKSVL